MKKIEAIIRKSRFEDVKKALLVADIEWFSYYNVRGEGKMRQARIYRGVMYDTSSIERVLLNIVVRDKNIMRFLKQWSSFRICLQRILSMQKEWL